MGHLKTLYRLLFCINLFSFGQVMAYVSEKDVVYDTINGIALKMDVFKPTIARSGLSPAAVFIHGGCFSGGSKDAISTQMKSLADEGFIVFSLSYRLSTVAKYPAAVTDIQQAIRFIRKNSSRFQIDPNKIASHGESAGGYLASILGLRAMPDRNGVIDQYSSRVQAVSDWFGRTDFTLPQASGSDCAASFLGLARTPENQSRFEEASLLKDVSAQSAQFHIMHGTHDPQVAPVHSTLLAQQLWNAGKKADLYLSEGDVHALPGTAPWRLTRKFLLNQFQLVDNTASSTYNSAQRLSLDSGELTRNTAAFSPDAFYLNDGSFASNYENTTAFQTANTTSPALYQSVRAGKNFSYAIDVQAGVYRLEYYVAEKHASINKVGDRVFNVSLQFPTSTTDATMINHNVLASLDIIKLVGKHYAFKRNIHIISKNKKIYLNLKSLSNGNAIISAFQLVPVAY